MKIATAKWWWAISEGYCEYVSCFNEDENVNIAWPVYLLDVILLSGSSDVQYDDQWKLKINKVGYTWKNKN